MTIQITKPEVEALINQRESTFSDRRVQGRRGRCVAGPSVFAPTSGSNPAKSAQPAKNPVELFAPLRGLNIDFESDRSKDTGRDINL